MATNTTNFNLSKPDYTDTADIAVINSNMDKVDVSLNGLADAIAIVAKNNTHAAIMEGQYVYVHGHGSLAEGLYTAKSNIAANATLSTSNLQADGSGGLNALNSNVGNINKIDSTETINFDTETKFLVYTNTSSSTGTKPVTTNNGYLFTFIRADATRLQIFREGATSSKRVYLRTMYSSTWSDWMYITFT